MSTVVVVRKNKSVVIGADTLAKHGSTKQSASLLMNHSKIFKAGNTYFGLVGEASWTLVLGDYFQSLKPFPRLDSQRNIFRFARTLHQSLKKDYFLNPKEDEKDEFESSQISCLIANPHGIFGLYALRSVDEFRRFYAFGSGGKYALGAMRAVYARAKTAAHVARAGLEAAAEFDEDSGLPFEIRSVRLRSGKGT